MVYKSVVFVLTLVVSCLALPAQDLGFQEEVSPFFINTDVNSRILGGTQAAPGSAPYMVALTVGNFIRSLFCGASLISQRTILTAAHCTAGVFTGGSLLASLQGTVGTNSWASGGQSYSITRNISHPGYDRPTIKNDICLLITASDVVLNDIVRPVAIDVNGQVLEYQSALMVGGAGSPTLIELMKHTVDGEVCQTEVARVSASVNMIAPPVDPALEICTYHSAGHGMCHGDSGSALIRQDNLQQVGIVSWGIPCAIGAPDMFVRVSAYRSWIDQNIV